MKFRRLKVRADTDGIGPSHVLDTESGEMIYGVADIAWKFDPTDGHGIVVLTFHATDIDFEVIRPPGHKE